MKRKIKNIAQKTSQNPVLRETAKSIKPSRSIWGVLGVFLFFILPEIIGFWRGKEIASWAHQEFLQEPSKIGRATYWLLEKLFENGGSYLNLSIGILLLYWIWWDWQKEKKEKKKWEEIEL